MRNLSRISVCKEYWENQKVYNNNELIREMYMRNHVRILSGKGMNDIVMVIVITADMKLNDIQAILNRTR